MLLVNGQLALNFSPRGLVNFFSWLCKVLSTFSLGLKNSWPLRGLEKVMTIVLTMLLRLTRVQNHIKINTIASAQVVRDDIFETSALK